MSDDGGIVDSLGKMPQRFASMIELLTTLDQRIITALDSLEEMRTSMGTLDERLNRDLDELRSAVKTKLDEVDLAAFEGRFGRLEQAILNIEKATINLDRNVAGAIEGLPDFITKKMKGPAAAG